MPFEPSLLAKARFILVSDLDWTMVDHKDETHEKLLAFNRLWTTHFAADSLLVFSTGRSPELFRQLATECPLLTPDILVCSVGTEILINGSADSEWEAHLDEGWDRDTAAAVASRFPELILQQVSEQRPHKVSYKLFASDAAQAAAVVANLRGQLAAAGLDTNVVFSGGEDLDILPARASKGKALSFLLRQLRWAGGPAAAAAVLVCGDSGNDIELFEVPDVHGCVVANAHAELKDWYEANGAENGQVHAAAADGPGGITETLRHFGFVPNDDEINSSSTAAQKIGRRKAVVELHRFFESYFCCDPSSPPDLEFDPDGGLAAFEDALSEVFELVGPQGTVQTRAELLGWFKEAGRGSRLPPTPTPAAALLAPPEAPSGLLSAALGSADMPSTPTGIESPSPIESGRFRIWIDSLSERELSPGLWIVRYKEVHQRFPGTPAGRRTRWSSAVLREVEGGGGGNGHGAAWAGYRWEYVHETWTQD